MSALPKPMIYGTSRAGYVGAKDGPFKCSTCRFFVLPDDCLHPEVLLDPQVPKETEDGIKVAKVEAAACCGFWHPRKGK